MKTWNTAHPIPPISWYHSLLKVAEQQVISILAKGGLSKKQDKGIGKTVIVGQIRKYIQSYDLLEKDREYGIDDLLDALSLSLHDVSLKRRTLYSLSTLSDSGHGRKAIMLIINLMGGSIREEGMLVKTWVK